MPELPEVETIKRQLSNQIKDKKITKIVAQYPKIIKAPLEKFKGAVLGARIKNIRRRGKLIIMDLSSGFSLLIHLGMTGQLLYDRGTTRNKTRNYAENFSNKHTRVIFHFADGSQLIFNDIRKFGYINLMLTENLGEYLNKKYGPEPLDKNFTLVKFQKILAQKTKQKKKFSLKKISLRPNGRKIKQFLMDQKNIAGIGNIYADEILFYASVMPDRKISTLTKNEIKKIFQGIKKILTKAIKYRGSSVANYVDSQGRAGEYHLYLSAYGRAGQPCPKCKTPIKKIKLSGRGTHFCLKCQK